MRVIKVLATLAVFTAPLSVAVQAASAPGECGEYKYWKAGSCHDARNAPATPWAEQMGKKISW